MVQSLDDPIEEWLFRVFGGAYEAGGAKAGFYKVEEPAAHVLA